MSSSRNSSDDQDGEITPSFPNRFRNVQTSKSSSYSTKPVDERTSLLPKEPPSSNPSESSSVLSGRDGESFIVSEDSSSKLILWEFLILMKASVPIIIAYTLQNSLQTCSVLIVGRLSPAHLAVAAFSYMFAMSTAWLIALGGTTALDTLCSSSFTGSKNPYDLGILLQRAFVVLGGMYAVVCVLWWNSESLFLHLGQDPQLSKESARFLRYLIPGGLGYIYFEAGKKYLQAQGINGAGTSVLIIMSPFNAALNYLFVYTLKFDLIGAPIATGISYWLCFLGIGIYSRYFSTGHKCWGGWSITESLFPLIRLATFLRLATLGVIMVGTEWWAFEIVALLAGKLGPIPLASQSIIMTTDQILNTIPFGIGIATSTRLGNMLGARNASGARRTAHVAAFLSIFLGGVVLIVLFSTRYVFPKIFSDDVRVIKLTASVLPYVALFQIADGLNGSCGGSLRGMGRQHVGAIVNILSYYFGALPLGVYLAFWKNWGLEGLWVGQCVALYLVGVGMWGLVARSRWDKEVGKAFERMEHSSADS